MKRHFLLLITALQTVVYGTNVPVNVEIGPNAVNSLSHVKHSDTAISLDTMRVTARQMQAVPVTLAPQEVFTAADIESKAGVAGDISRYIATLPSTVSSLSDNFDNALYVRGGRPSEVVFLVDGIEMENINHFSRANGSGGPLGFINSDYVKKVSFFAGNSPAMYPSRLSSVVAIDLKNGSFSERQSSLGCKLTGGMFATEGPVLDGKASYLCTGRYIDFGTLGNFVKDRGVPRLGDCCIKANLVTGDHSDCSFTGVFSANSFTIEYPVSEPDDISGELHWNRSQEQQRIKQGGVGCTYRMSGAFGKHTITASGSFRDGDIDEKFHDFTDPFFTARYTDNPFVGEHDARYRATLTSLSEIGLTSWLNLSSGIRTQYQYYRMSTYNRRHYEGDYTYCDDGHAVSVERFEDTRSRHIQFETGEAGGFCELGGKAGDFSASIGTRIDYYQLLTSLAVSPRIMVSYAPASLGTLTFASGVQHQFPTEMPSLLLYTYAQLPALSDAQSERNILDVLGNIEPLRCYQTSLGFERKVASWCNVKTDGYYKWYNREYHIISPEVQEVFTFNDRQELVLYPQDGKRKSYGIECMVESSAGKRLHVTVGGSLFQVKNRYRDGTWYDDWTNVGYTGSCTAVLEPFSGHLVSIGILANGGRPYCREVISEDCLGRKSASLQSGQQYFTDRLDRIISLNIRYGIKKQFGKANAGLFVEILNVMNNQPTLEYRFTGDTFTAIKPFGIFPIIGGDVSW